MTALPEDVPLPLGLPALADAGLPGIYVETKRALQKLERLDLCR
jgi:hypothetical protein